METLRHTVLKWGTIITLFLTPIVCFGNKVFPHMTTKTFFFYGIVELLFALWVYMIATDRTYRLSKWQWLYLFPFIAYIIWMSVAGIYAVDPGLALWGSLMRGTGLLTLYHGLGFVLVLSSLVRKYGTDFSIQILKWSVAAGAIVGASIWLGDEGLGLPMKVLQKASGGGLVGNSSLAAAYLLFVLAFASALLAAREVSTKTKRWVWISGGIVIFSPIFINLLGLFNGRGIWGSARGATLAIVVSVVVAALWYLVTSRNRVVRISGVVGIVVGSILFTVVWIQLMTPGTFIQQKFVNATSETRFTFWSIASRAMTERPLVGYGPENFPRAVQTYFEPQLLSKDQGFEIWTDKAHNIYYDTGVAGGYPAIVLYIGFLIAILVGVSVAYRSGKLTRVQASILVGLVIGYVFQNLFVFDSIASLFVLFVLIGIVGGLVGDVVDEKMKPKPVSEALQYALGGILLVVGILGWYQFGFAPSRKAAAFGSVLGDAVNNRSARYAELLHTSPVGNYWDVGGFAHDEYKLYAKNPDAIKADVKLLPYAKKDIVAFIEYAEAVALKDPTDYRLQLSIVHLYSTHIYLNDLPFDQVLADKINAHITLGHELAPRDPQLYWAEAQMAAWENDLPGVIAAYQKGVDIDPKLASSQRLLLEFLQALGDKKGYDLALAKAQKVIPGFSIDK